MPQILEILEYIGDARGSHLASRVDHAPTVGDAGNADRQCDVVPENNVDSPKQGGERNEGETKQDACIMRSWNKMFHVLSSSHFPDPPYASRCPSLGHTDRSVGIDQIETASKAPERPSGPNHVVMLGLTDCRVPG